MDREGRKALTVDLCRIAVEPDSVEDPVVSLAYPLPELGVRLRAGHERVEHRLGHESRQLVEAAGARERRELLADRVPAVMGEHRAVRRRGRVESELLPNVDLIPGVGRRRFD